MRSKTISCTMHEKREAELIAKALVGRTVTSMEEEGGRPLLTFDDGSTLLVMASWGEETDLHYTPAPGLTGSPCPLGNSIS